MSWYFSFINLKKNILRTIPQGGEGADEQRYSFCGRKMRCLPMKSNFNVEILCLVKKRIVFAFLFALRSEQWVRHIHNENVFYLMTSTSLIFYSCGNVEREGENEISIFFSPPTFVFDVLWLISQEDLVKCDGLYSFDFPYPSVREYCQHCPLCQALNRIVKTDFDDGTVWRLNPL